jgi:hypothetical protein
VPLLAVQQRIQQQQQPKQQRQQLPTPVGYGVILWLLRNPQTAMRRWRPHRPSRSRACAQQRQQKQQQEEQLQMQSEQPQQLPNLWLLLQERQHQI